MPVRKASPERGAALREQDEDGGSDGDATHGRREGQRYQLNRRSPHRVSDLDLDLRLADRACSFSTTPLPSLDVVMAFPHPLVHVIQPYRQPPSPTTTASSHALASTSVHHLTMARPGIPSADRTRRHRHAGDQPEHAAAGDHEGEDRAEQSRGAPTRDGAGERKGRRTAGRSRGRPGGRRAPGREQVPRSLLAGLDDRAADPCSSPGYRWGSNRADAQPATPRPGRAMPSHIRDGADGRPDAAARPHQVSSSPAPEG